MAYILSCYKNVTVDTTNEESDKEKIEEKLISDMDRIDENRISDKYVDAGELGNAEAEDLTEHSTFWTSQTVCCGIFTSGHQVPILAVSFKVN